MLKVRFDNPDHGLERDDTDSAGVEEQLRTTAQTVYGTGSVTHDIAITDVGQ